MRSEPGEHVGVDRRERREFLQVLVALQSPCTVTRAVLRRFRFNLFVLLSAASWPRT